MPQSLRFWLLLCTLCILSGCEGITSREDHTVSIGTQLWQVEIADTYETRAKGLMKRKRLKDNTGMLFVFNRDDRHGFWMKHTLIPLDIIWMNQEKTIVDIKHNIPPCPPEKSREDQCPMYVPQAKARYVLEVNADTFKGNLGDKVDFSWTPQFRN